MKLKILAFLFTILFFSSLAFSDGFIVHQPSDLEEWTLSQEQMQVAALSLENGKEQLKLAVNVDLVGEKAAWLVPIHAKPEKINVKISDSFPNIYGTSVESKFKELFNNGFLLSVIPQVYLLPFEIVALSINSLGFSAGNKTLGAPVLKEASSYLDSEETMYNIEVFQKTTANGLSSEVIRTQDKASFFQFLQTKGMRLNESTKQAIGEYLQKNNSFVLTWVSDVQALKAQGSIPFPNSEYAPNNYQTRTNVLAIDLEFPASKLYFPLTPSRVYGNSKVPVLLFVKGWVSPELFPAIQGKTMVEYLENSSYANPNNGLNLIDAETPPNSFLGTYWNGKFTKIRIDSFASDFTQDLSIECAEPANVSVMNFFTENSGIFYLLAFIIISCLSSLLAAWVVFKNKKPEYWKFAALGFANFLSIIGFSVISYFLKVEEKFVKNPRVKAKTKGNAFFAILILTLVSTVIILIVLGAFLSSTFMNSYYHSSVELLVVPLCIAIGLGIVWAPAAILWIFRKKNPELAQFCSVQAILSVVLAFVLMLCLPLVF